MLFSGPGLNPNLRGLVNNMVTLNASEVWNFSPAGWYETRPGKYTNLQEYDPITTIWRSIGSANAEGGLWRIYSDGTNYRLSNQTGCAVGALITNAGTLYTSAPVVTASAGGSKWLAIVGGALSTVVTVTAGGTNYSYPPTLFIQPPPSPGIQATGYAVLTGSAVTSIVITDQGAGYTFPPVFTFFNDPREGVNGVTIGSGAVAIGSITGAGTITGLLCIDHGTGIQTVLPTLAFSGGGGSGAAATTIMCWSITAYNLSATTTGSGFAPPVLVSAFGGFPATASAYVNPSTQSQLVKGRNALIVGATSGVGLTTTGEVVLDGGIYPGAPTTFVVTGGPSGSGGVPAIFLAPTMGGQVDISIVLTT